MGWYPYSHNTCFHCRKVFAYEGSRVCPECGYYGGRQVVAEGDSPEGSSQQSR